MFKTLLYRWQNAYRAKVSNRQAYYVPKALDDRLLRDTGLCRYDLLAIKYGGSPSKGSNDHEPRSFDERSATFHRFQAIGE